jgi:hypothetical protein
MNIARRGMCKSTLATLVRGRRWLGSSQAFAAEDLKVSDNAPGVKLDFETKGVDDWSTVDGQWTVEEMAGAPSGKKVLVQRASRFRGAKMPRAGSCSGSPPSMT